MDNDVKNSHFKRLINTLERVGTHVNIEIIYSEHDLNESPRFVQNLSLLSDRIKVTTIYLMGDELEELMEELETVDTPIVLINGQVSFIGEPSEKELVDKILSMVDKNREQFTRYM